MFGKRPPKLDPRIRFQHQSFTRKLEQARQYKREPQAIPEDWPGYILAKLGLNSRLSQVMSLLVLAGLIYLVFIPNFLSAKNIQVRGLGEDDTKRITADVAAYLDNAPFYLAQHNIIFLRQSQLEQALLKDNKVYKVKQVKKNLWSRSVSITVEMKAPKYVALRNNQVYSIYNDGSVQEQLALDPEQWLAASPGTVKIQDDNQDALSADTQYLSQDFLVQIDQITDRYEQATRNSIDYFAVPAGAILPLVPDDLVVFVKKPGNKADYKVIFDAQQDWDKTFGQLELLFSQMPPDRYNKLVYIDLRFKERAFLCLSDAPCAKEPEPEPEPPPGDQPSSELFDISSPSSTKQPLSP